MNVYNTLPYSPRRKDGIVKKIQASRPSINFRIFSRVVNFEMIEMSSQGAYQGLKSKFGHFFI